MTELVIFDLDGVLIDSEVLACRALAEELATDGHAITTDEVIARFVGVSHAAMTATIERDSGRPLATDFNRRANARMQALFAAELRAIAGAEALLASLALPVCIASNSPPDYIDRNVALTGLETFFPADTRFSSALVERPKPAPDVYLHAAAEMGAAPDACLVVEDSATGVRAARDAGMRVLGFVGAGHVTDAADLSASLEAAGARAVLHELDQLLGFLRDTDVTSINPIVT